MSGTAPGQICICLCPDEGCQTFVCALKRPHARMKQININVFCDILLWCVGLDTHLSILPGSSRFRAQCFGTADDPGLNDPAFIHLVNHDQFNFPPTLWKVTGHLLVIHDDRAHYNALS